MHFNSLFRLSRICKIFLSAKKCAHGRAAYTIAKRIEKAAVRISKAICMECISIWDSDTEEDHHW